jgi:transcriptional regulator with XRE-family HTH domain
MNNQDFLDTMKNFGLLLEEFRKTRDISKKHLAVRAHLSPSYITLLIQGEKKNPSLDTVMSLARALNLSPEETDLLFDEADISPEQRNRPYQPVYSVSNGGADGGSTFVVGPPILHPHQFFGREREIREIFSILKQPPFQHIALVCPHRSGKTSLLHYLKGIATAATATLRPDQRSSHVLQLASYNWILVDFQNVRMRKPGPLLCSILEHMQMPVPETCTLDSFMETFEEHVLDTPTIIMMDEIGAALDAFDLEFWESFRSLANTYTNGFLSFIVTASQQPSLLANQQGRSSPFFNIFGHTIKMGPLLPDEAHYLIASSPIPFNATDSLWIIQQSGCWPSLLQFCCDTLLTSLQHKETGDDWKQEALERIEPYRYLLEQSSP